MINEQNMKNDLPLISALLAVRNESRFILETLNALSEQDYPKDLLEVIVIDGNSDDDTINKALSCKDKFKHFKMIENPSLLSSAGWNKGIENASGEIVTILSGHVLLENNYFSKVVKHLTSDICGLGGRAVPKGFNKLSRLIAKAYRSKLGSGGATYINGDKNEEAETISFGSYWKKDLLDIGGFDENVVRGQDWDLNLRLRKKGHKLIFNPDLKTVYYVRDSLSSLWRRQYKAGLWKWYINRKSTKHILLRHLIPGLFSVVLILLAGLSLFSYTAQILLGISVLSYVLMVGIVSKSNKIRFLDYFKILSIFFIIHFAYGIGIILGLSKK